MNYHSEIKRLVADLRSRANHVYADCIGTESYDIDNLLDEVASLRSQRDYILSAARRTLDENWHLADGDNCTLWVLKRAVETLTGT